MPTEVSGQNTIGVKVRKKDSATPFYKLIVLFSRSRRLPPPSPLCLFANLALNMTQTLRKVYISFPNIYWGTARSTRVCPILNLQSAG